MNYIFEFTVPFVIVYLLTPEVRYLGLKLSVLDKKNHRKIHAKKVVAKFGGIGIYLGLLAGLVIMAVYDYSEFRVHLFDILGLVICASLALFLGMYDDFQGSNAHTKFFVQILIAFLLIKLGFVIHHIYIPGVCDFSLGWFSIPVTVLWFAGISNAVNLIDGLDGLAGGIVAISCLFLCFYGLFLGDNFVCYIALALSGAIAGFLNYNFYPAKIFMGDSGSLFLGCVMAMLGAYTNRGWNIPNPLLFPVSWLLLVPILDTLFAVVRRLSRKQYIFSSDSCHIHHFFLKKGFSQIQAVLVLYLITFILGLLLLWITCLRH